MARPGLGWTEEPDLAGGRRKNGSDSAWGREEGPQAPVLDARLDCDTAYPESLGVSNDDCSARSPLLRWEGSVCLLSVSPSCLPTSQSCEWWQLLENRQTVELRREAQPWSQLSPLCPGSRRSIRRRGDVAREGLFTHFCSRQAFWLA